MRVMRMVVFLVLLSVVGSTFLACGDSQPLPTPTVSPIAFSMRVIPPQIEDSVTGQRCVFLVAVSGPGEAVDVWAIAEGSTVTVHPQAIAPGQVAEVTVIPDEGSRGETLTVAIVGERDGLKRIETASVKVGEPLPGDLAPYATEMRDRFIPWLATNHPEFGITGETEWTPTVVCPHIVVVMYYLFFSEDWEMGVRWHVTIPPHDYAEIYLRHRTTEIHPSYGFKISSVTAQEEPQAVDPEPSVWR